MSKKPQPVIGRPPYEASDKDRGRVEAYTQCGYSQASIAARLEIDEKTLRAHYRKELDFGTMDLLAGATNALGRKALGAPAVFDDKGNCLRAEVVSELGAICYLLKTKGKRLGWSERLELTGNDGGPIETTDAAAKLLDLLTRRPVGEGAGTGGGKPH